MKLILKLIVFLVIFFLTFGCDDDSPANLLINSPKCRITNQSDLIVPDFGFSTMNFTVENYGDGPTAFDISVYVKLKRGNYILDESGTDLGSLLKGESKSGDVTFVKVKSRSEYDMVEISFYWYDAEGKYYN